MVNSSKKEIQTWDFCEEKEASMDVHLNKVQQIFLLFPFFKSVMGIHVEY